MWDEYLRSAESNSRGTASGSKNLLTMVYSAAVGDMKPKLLSSKPARVLTSGPLSSFPNFVFSDLHVGAAVCDGRVRCLVWRTSMFEVSHHIPAAPAKVRHAHTFQGVLTGTARAAQVVSLLCLVRVRDAGLELGLGVMIGVGLINLERGTTTPLPCCCRSGRPRCITDHV